MSALTFTPGKFYKTRDGRKYECLKTGLCFYTKDTGMAGLVYNKDGTVEMRCHHGSGNYLSGSEHHLDLIAEWSDAPEVDWSKMPEGTQSVFQNGYKGKWIASTNIAALGAVSFTGSAYGKWFELYPQHVPKWSGDWRDSLVTRPTEGAQP